MRVLNVTLCFVDQFMRLFPEKVSSVILAWIAVSGHGSFFIAAVPNDLITIPLKYEIVPSTSSATSMNAEARYFVQVDFGVNGNQSQSMDCLLGIKALTAMIYS